MHQKFNKILKALFSEFNSKYKIPAPDNSLKHRLYSTIPQNEKSQTFFTRNKLIIAFGITLVCILFIFLILPDKKEFKPTKKIVIADKLDPDHFKPTKVVTITAADQIQ